MKKFTETIKASKESKALTEKTEAQKKYAEFFTGKLDKYGVASPTELSDEDKKKFFDEVEKEWTAQSESSEEKKTEVVKVEETESYVRKMRLSPDKAFLEDLAKNNELDEVCGEDFAPYGEQETKANTKFNEMVEKGYLKIVDEDNFIFAFTDKGKKLIGVKESEVNEANEDQIKAQEIKIKNLEDHLKVIKNEKTYHSKEDKDGKEKWDLKASELQKEIKDAKDKLKDLKSKKNESEEIIFDAAVLEAAFTNAQKHGNYPEGSRLMGVSQFVSLIDVDGELYIHAGDGKDSETFKFDKEGLVISPETQKLITVLKKAKTFDDIKAIKGVNPCADINEAKGTTEKEETFNFKGGKVTLKYDGKGTMNVYFNDESVIHTDANSKNSDITRAKGFVEDYLERKDKKNESAPTKQICIFTRPTKCNLGQFLDVVGDTSKNPYVVVESVTGTTEGLSIVLNETATTVEIAKFVNLVEKSFDTKLVKSDAKVDEANIFEIVDCLPLSDFDKGRVKEMLAKNPVNPTMLDRIGDELVKVCATLGLQIK